jgi:hypothetical protein
MPAGRVIFLRAGAVAFEPRKLTTGVFCIVPENVEAVSGRASPESPVRKLSANQPQHLELFWIGGHGTVP